MADPVSLAALAGASALVKAGGDIFSGQAQAATATYQAGLATINQNIAKQNASYALAVGEAQAQQSGMKTRAEVGTTRASQASSGLAVDTGTAEKVVESEEEHGAYNQSLIRSDAAKRAYGFEVEETQQVAQQHLYESAAANAKTAAMISAVGSILGGATSVAGKFADAQRVAGGMGNMAGPFSSASPNLTGQYMPGKGLIG